MKFGCDLRQTTQLWRGIYERCLQDWLTRSVRPGDVCLDIGAADGYFTLLIAKLAGPSGRVFAFEPGENATEVNDNLARNAEFPLARVELFRSFVSNTMSVNSIALDAFIAERNIGRVHVVKLDVDGGEVDVIRSMTHILGRDHPHIFIEVHSKDLLAEVVAILQRYQYKMKLEKPLAHEHRPIDFNMFYYSE